MWCCISFESYIKPQHFYRVANWEDVVYLLNPTSNHNCNADEVDKNGVVYLLNPTSNHNPLLDYGIALEVVYLLNPTSNHNERMLIAVIWALYIF